ncbi:MAG TPA: xanthine dehydrogenase family protein molybdopterin-binding subunit, partial [Dehalococcoidia bacterium]|nr:xanthine dehydrogenase family protein molybdopterin-binding subunit [Dehalococcoidia bacterium]
MAEFQVIGKPAPRKDGIEKVTGTARYTADFLPPGTLHGKTLKSPLPHARIVHIDTSKAKQLPGVHAVLTGADVRDAGLWGRAVKDVPVLAIDRVRFAGERVAAVAAEDEDVAEEALQSIEVEYEELPAVLTPEEAMAPGAPILHPDFNSYFGFRQKMETPSNVFYSTHLERGDIEAGFAEADLVVEATYETQRMHQGYLEPQAVLVDISGGRVHVWLCSKVPYNTRESLAFAARIPEEQILFHHTHIGGDFGGKGNARNTPVAYFLAKATGRPVKIVSDYIEEFGAGNPRHHTLTRLKTGVKRDGTIVAHQVEYIVDSGAYAAFKPLGTIGGANQAAGPYRIPNVVIDSRFVYTNTVPGGFMRAPGDPQGVFPLESHLDDIARRLGMSPAEFKRKNLVREGDETAWGERLQHVRAVETLDAVLRVSGFEAPKPPNVGRGLAIADRGTGGGEGTAEVTLKPDGTVIVGTPIFDQGTGTYTTLAQIAAEELGVEIDKVSVDVWDSDAVPFDSGVAGSRASRVNTAAAHEAVQAALTRLLALACERYGCAPEALSFSRGQIRRTDIEESVPWWQFLAEIGETVSGRAHVQEGGPGQPRISSFYAQVAEVSVDPETGEVKLLKLTAANDVGTVINPIGHQGQINGAVIQGVGYALMEEVRVEDGRATTLSFGDYKIPNIRDIPALETVLLQSEAGYGPFNVRGIGEGPHIPVAAAV